MMISVIIINKNDLGILDTINGLSDQDYDGKFEIIIVDRSTIKYPKITSKVPLRWIAFDPKNKRYTIPEQRNIGIKESSGEIVVFIDANCVPKKNWLSILVQPLLDDGEKIVMGKTGSIGKPTLNDLNHDKLAQEKYVDEAPTINLAVLKKVFDKVGFFDEALEYGSDVDFSWRAIDKGYCIRYQPQAYISHNWGDKKEELKRTILYGKARARLLIKHIKTRWKNLLGKDSPVILYPILILCLPIVFVFPWYLLLFVMLVLKNIREPNPIGIVIKHIIYGVGVLLEIIKQLLRGMLRFIEKVNNLNFANIIGFELFATILYGLALNFLLPKFGVSSPLSYQYIWPAFILILVPMIKLLIGIKKWLVGDITSWFLKIILLANPIIAIMGVYLLDNTGNASLAMTSVVLICLSFVFIFLKKKDTEDVLKLSLYSSAISLLLANSLRSHFLVGWDIHQEYLVFRLTNLHNFWDINAIKDAYNACLSITILPTIIRNLFGIEQLTVFRFIIPLIIALVPVVVYQIGTRVLDKKVAYAGAFIFLLQTQYFSQLPALLRQGVAFLFFALLIDILLIPGTNHKRRNIAFLIFGTGMVLSHYSTTYVALALLLFAKFFTVLFCKFYNFRKKTSSLTFRSIAILFVITFLWNMLITNTAQGLTQTVLKVISNIGTTFSLENKSEMVKNIFYQQSDNASAVISYSNQSIKTSSNPENYKGYEIFPVSLNFGKPMLITDPIPAYFHILIPWLFRLSIVIGFVFLVKREFRRRQSPLIFSMAVSMFIITTSVVLLPYLSVDYNFERVFQQMLILLAPISIFGLMTMFKLIKKVPASIPIVIILLSYIIQTTGLIDRLVYNNSSWMFDNSGEQYDRYYTSVEEVKGINWLEQNTGSNQLLYADRYTKLRLIAYSNQEFSYISSQINPPVIEKYGYVFSGLAGSNADVVFATINNRSLTFNFPHKYLLENKNTIYSNSIAKIYR